MLYHTCQCLHLLSCRRQGDCQAAEREALLERVQAALSTRIARELVKSRDAAGALAGLRNGDGPANQEGEPTLPGGGSAAATTPTVAAAAGTGSDNNNGTSRGAGPGRAGVGEGDTGTAQEGPDTGAS
jgi:hypothetical protein